MTTLRDRLVALADGADGMCPLCLVAEARESNERAHAETERRMRAEAERDALWADAQRYRWLRPRLYSLDFDYGDEHRTVLVFEAPLGELGPGIVLDAALDAARAKVQP